MPGQTTCHALQPLQHFSPSMEGRAIARPNADASAELLTALGLQWRAGQLPGQTRQHRRAAPPTPRTFNGGPGNCPAKRGRTRPRTRRDRCPSMEGRAIARPNLRLWATWGGSIEILQWRAGQLPGQTPRRPDAAVGSADPSMEGRAIARPNLGGPAMKKHDAETLQWRAGQLPGQTRPPRHTSAAARTFNGGPGNCPAKRGTRRRGDGPRGPSMEGRAIARPNVAGVFVLIIPA